jgi:hypothetical protein
MQKSSRSLLNFKIKKDNIPWYLKIFKTFLKIGDVGEWSEVYLSKKLWNKF